MKRHRLIVLALVLAPVVSLGAQQPAAPVAQPNRAVLEQQLRARMAQMIKTRLNLTDQQMTQLQTVNQKYAPQISRLAMQERETRQHLRGQIMSGTPDQGQVAQLLDTILRLQKERVALLESEQHDLAAFLTPVQRAQYMGLQAQIERRAEQLRRQPMTGPGGMRGRAGLRDLR